MDPNRLEDDIARIACLAEPVRRALYFHVVASDDGSGRDEAARAVGVTRALAAFHLDRLVREGLLVADYRRPSGRGGPGAGRPAKRYRRSVRQVAVSLPARNYELAARLLARAAEAGGGPAALDRAARELGGSLGASARQRAGPGAGRERIMEAAIEVLGAAGFEPWREPGRVRLRNCPFQAIADEHSDLVCGMNRAFMEGFLGGLEVRSASADADPDPGTCCVLLRVTGARGRP